MTDTLRELALRATKGWDRTRIRATDTAFIDAANPTAILSLLDKYDAALRIAKDVSKALTGITPGGSEYHSYSSALDDYFADTEACVAVIRDRFDSGHKAKLELVETRRERDAALAEIERLKEALRRGDDLLGALRKYGFPVSDAAARALVDGGSIEAQAVHVAAIGFKEHLARALTSPETP